jgi:gliding motility-associated-like protein
VLTTAAQQYCASDPSFSLNILFTTPPSAVGDFWTNPSGTAVPASTLNPATATSGVYTYTVTNGCGSDDVTIFISIESAPNAGTSGSLPVCENAIAPVDLFAALGTGVTAGGTWAGPVGPTTSTFNIGDPAGAYTYTVSSSPFGLCTESATITVSYTAVADAGTDRSVIACDNDITFFLFDSLGGTPDPGGTWSPFTAFTPGVSPSGTPSTYTILNPGCPPSTASVTVTVQPAPSAGTNTSIALCQSLGSIDLTSYLNGSPQTGGVWTDSGTGATVPNSFDISASCGNTIQLEYTVTAGACSNSSTMQITVECPPNAGADVTTTECADNTNFNLFSILDVGADATGTFTNNTSGLTVPGGIVQLNGAAAGTYSYTVAGAQCANDVATCTLNLESPITVVIDAQCTPAQTEYVVTLTVSGGDGNYSVTGLPGGPFVGNTYVSNPIPAGNTYSFSVDDSGPCASFVQGATAGPNCTCPANAQFVGPSVSICEGGTADIELNFPSGTGPFTIDYTDGTNTFTNVGPFTSGSFLQVTPTTTTFYTLTGVSDQNCSTSVNSSITVVVEPTPDAGPDVVSTFCGSGGVIVLSSLVDPAIAPGVFTNSSGTTVSTIPQTSASSGTYTYTVSGTQCPDDQATYALTILDPISVSVVSAVCNPAQTDYTVTLEISGGDGNYTVSGIAGTLNTGVNPAIFTSNLIPTGTPYSYVVSDGGPCPDVLAGPINSPNCACPASAQFADPSVTICAGSTANIELNFPSGASPFTIDYTDGTNTFTNQGPFTSGSFLQVTPATTTTYTLTGVSDQNCSTSVNDVIQVVVEPIPNAGPDVTEDLCGAGGTLSLSSLIDPSDDQSGIFTNPGGVAVTNVPLTSASSGTYTYTISGNQCPDDQATYTLTISNPISVNVASAVCNPAQTGYTVTLEISGGDGNYTVSGLAGTLNTGVSPAIFTSNLIPTGTPYSYVVSDGGPCPDVVAGPINSPNCACPANVQFADPSVTICEGSTANIELNFPSGTGPFTIDYNDGTNTFTNEGPYTSGDFLSVNPAVTTTYNLTGVADQNCNTSASGSITVFVETPPNAGPDVTETFCASGAPFNLINLVDGSVASTTGSFFTSAGNPVPGNTITLNSASSDVYTYEVTGTECPADEASYVITINDQVAISNISVDCNSAQTGYTVSFDIVGGDGNYTVVAAGAYDGTIIPGGTVSYESALIPNDTDYSFTISDGSPCSDQVVSGIDPDCDCPASAALSGTASICSGGCATLTFNFQGDGPWDVVYENSLDPSNPEALTDIPNGHIITVCPDETVTYTILSVNDINCSGPVNGQPVTITVDSPLTVSSVTETCDNIGENYTVGFTVSDGVPGTYQVTPTGESFVGGAYESFDINSGDSYSFTVSDAGACPDVLVEGVEECACITEAGSIAPGLIETCENENLTIPINGDEVLDGNDGYQFILHDGSETEIGTIISRYDTPTFPVPTEVEFGQIYYITGVAGNTEFFGDVILTGECTDQTNGIPVIFHGLPSAQLTGLGAVCPGEEAELTVLFTGEGPWIFEYAIDGVSQTSISTADVEYAFTTTTTGSYTLVTVTDQNCEGPVSGQVQVTNFNTPTAVLSGDGDVCENSGDGPVVNLTGQAPFTLIYSIDGVPSPDPITSFSNELTIPAEVGGNYSLTSLTDANCVGTVSGNLDVTILTLPTAEITGGGSVCEGDELPFQVSLTGDGPWTVNYSVDGIPQPSITSPSNVFTFLSDIGGEYNITQVTDQNCEGEALESDASLIVNPLPTAEITSNEDAICIGQELELIYDLQGTPPFTLTYLLDSDTITLSGLTTDFLQTLQPTSPVFTEVLYIEDSSNPVCANTPNNSKFIPVGELPNMPVLEDYTICSEIDTLAIGEDGVPELEYSWTPADRLSNPNSPNPSFILGEDDLSPFVKEYTYVLTASNGDCVSDDTLTITVDPGPRARFSYNPNPVNSEDTKVRFLNQSSTDEDAIYFWQFDSLDTSQEYNPVFEFPGGSIANYTVILTVIDPMTGCIDEWSDIVEVKPEMIVYVPTAFTPDGDGLNDLWRPIMSNIDENDYVLLVYDRFGTVVFETSDPEKAWNGSSNGDDYFVKTGVYVWQIETKNPISLEDIDFKGTVTVIR